MKLNDFKYRVLLNNGKAQFKILLAHPMETGARRGNSTGDFIPEYYIQKFECYHKIKLVFDSEWSSSISKNSYLSFTLNDVDIGDPILFIWTDNFGESMQEEFNIGKNSKR